MKKIAIFLILFLVPVCATGFFIGPGNMMGMSQKTGVGDACGSGYSTLIGSDANTISDSEGGSICVPD